MPLRHNHFAIPARVEKDPQVPAIPSTVPDTKISQSLFAGVLRLGGATLVGQAVALAAWPFLSYRNPLARASAGPNGSPTCLTAWRSGE
jgi:hypothetical protein